MRKPEAGQTLIITVLAMTALLGFVGLAVDCGVLFHSERELQNAANSAAVAAASEIASGGYAAAALNDAATNGINGTNATVTVNHPPSSGSHLGPKYIEVVVAQSQQMTFGSLFHPKPVIIAARAVAELTNSSACIFVLDVVSPNSLFINGNTSAPACTVYSNSNANAILVQGSLNARAIGAVGSVTGPTIPQAQTGIVPPQDPLGTLPAPSIGGCISTNRVVTTATTLSPGTFCGTGVSPALTINTAALVNFSPGTYIFTGGLGLLVTNISHVSGSNVTFYLASGAVNIAGQVSLAAPLASGTYQGILLFQDKTDLSAATIGGFVGNSSISGVLYFPSAKLTLPANSSTTAEYGIFISKNLELDGAHTLRDYGAAPGIGVNPAKASILVE